MSVPSLTDLPFPLFTTTTDDGGQIGTCNRFAVIDNDTFAMVTWPDGRVTFDGSPAYTDWYHDLDVASVALAKAKAEEAEEAAQAAKDEDEPQEAAA